MNKKIIALLVFAIFSMIKEASAQTKDLKLVFIRHAEKPLKGDNLTCQGLNRALQIPAVLYNKFGVPAYLFVNCELSTINKRSLLFFRR